MKNLMINTRRIAMWVLKGILIILAGVAGALAGGLPSLTDSLMPYSD